MHCYFQRGYYSTTASQMLKLISAQIDQLVCKERSQAATSVGSKTFIFGSTRLFSLIVAATCQPATGPERITSLFGVLLQNSIKKLLKHILSSFEKRKGK